MIGSGSTTDSGITTGLLLGGALGAALCLLAYALAAPAPGLGTLARRWQTQRDRAAAASPTAQDQPTAGALSSTAPSAGRWMVGRLQDHGFTFTRVRSDLDLVDGTLEAHLVRKCGYGVVGLLLPGLVALAVGVVGVQLPVVTSALASLALAGLLFWVPDLSLAQAAEARRSELRRGLSCYLDLVAMSLSGGRGVPEALPAAAKIGSGWAFDLLRDTLDHARYVGATPWSAFADLGRRVRVQELQDLGGALMLVADDGAKVRSSLTARASTQRRRQLAEAEGAAAKADQTIQMAQVVLAAGFFLFLGYPAVVAVMGI